MYRIRTNPKPRLNPNGVLVWSPYLGSPHRENGPAKIWPNGKKEWWYKGQRHRKDGPAVIYPDIRKEWWLDGVRHRDDGPAIVYLSHNIIWWYIWGTAIDFKDWCKVLKKTDEEIIQLKLIYHGAKHGTP